MPKSLVFFFFFLIPLGIPDQPKGIWKGFAQLLRAIPVWEHTPEPSGRAVTTESRRATPLRPSYLPRKASGFKGQKWSDTLSFHFKIIKLICELIHCKFSFILVIGRMKSIIHLLTLLGKKGVLICTITYIQGNLSLRKGNESGLGCWKVLLKSQYSWNLNHIWLSNHFRFWSAAGYEEDGLQSHTI